MTRRLAAGLFLLLALLPAAGADYRIDDARSQAAFSVRLLWLHRISGRFGRVDGTLLSGPHAGTVVVDAAIAVSDVGMASPWLRRWVLSPEFLDAARYPLIRFVSIPLSRAMLERGGALPGRLSLRGVTAPVRFTLHPLRCAAAVPRACRIALEGSVRRSTFGMAGHRAALSDQVELSLAIALTPLHS